MTLRLQIAEDITALGKKSVAATMTSITDWHYPYLLDRAKASRGWGRINGQTAEMDEAGNLIGPQNETSFHFFLISVNVPARGGTFRVTWDGSGEITSGTNLQVLNLSGPNSGATFDLAATGTAVLTFGNINWSNPPRNVSVIKTSDIAAYEAGQRISPAALTYLQQFAAYRTIGWQNANGNTSTTWANRAKLTDQIWSTPKGVPPEVLIDAANRANVDVWFCMPYLADDDYFEQFAILVRDTLSPDLTPYFEYSNECWNDTIHFPQMAYCRLQAWQEWAAPLGWVYDPQGSWDASFGSAQQATYSMTSDAGVHWQGKRSTRMMQIIRSVLGSRAKGVIGLHTIPSLSASPLVSTLWQSKDPANYIAPHTMHDALAVTGYFGHDVTKDPGLWNVLDTQGQAAAVARMLAAAATSINTFTRPSFAAAMTLAKQYNLRPFIYEANQHCALRGGDATLFVDNIQNGTPKPGVLEAMEVLNYSAGMAALHDEMRNAWRSLGGGLFTMFLDYGESGEFGSWGYQENESHDSLIFNELLAWQTANPKWWLG